MVCSRMTRRRAGDPSSESIIEIELRNFSTGAPHALTSRPTLHVMHYQAVSGRCHVSIEIVGDYLALLVLYLSPIVLTSDHFYLFDWKKGTLIMARLPSYFKAVEATDLEYFRHLILIITHTTPSSSCRLSSSFSPISEPNLSISFTYLLPYFHIPDLSH